MNIWDEKIIAWAQVKANVPALVDENLSFTYSELAATTDNLAAQLKRHGLKKNNRVLVVLPRTALSAVFLATLLRNHFVGLFLDTKTSANELFKIINTVKPHAIIAADVPAECHASEVVDLSVRTTPFLQPRLFILRSTEDVVAPENLTWLLGTSGSTGTIKAVMISAENLLARTQEEIADFQLSPGVHLLNCLPFSHDLGLNQLLTTLFLGGTLQIKSKAVSRLGDFLRNENITGLTGTPLMWIDFLESHFNEEIFPHLQFITISGGSLDIARALHLRHHFPNARILKTYGQTETFRTFISENVSSLELGRLAAGARIEISSEGELIHYGATCMLGYLFDPLLSKARMNFSAGNGVGVLTQDLVQQTTDGSYCFIGRKDDVIKRFEQRFHLSEVEAIVKTFHGVKDAVAITISAPKSDWRQIYLGLFVQLQTNAVLTSEQLLRACQENLSYYKVPDFIKTLDSFPTTASLKIDRQQLKLCMEQEQNLYARN